MTTALTSSGRLVKKASMPRTSGGLKALRFSGLLSFRIAISSQRSATSEGGNSQCGQAAEDFDFDMSDPKDRPLQQDSCTGSMRSGGDAASQTAEAREACSGFACGFELVFRD